MTTEEKMIQSLKEAIDMAEESHVDWLDKRDKANKGVNKSATNLRAAKKRLRDFEAEIHRNKHWTHMA